MAPQHSLRGNGENSVKVRNMAGRPIDAPPQSSSPSFWITGLGFGLYLAWGMMGSSPSLLSPDIAQAVSFTAIGSYPERLAWLAFLALYGLWAFIRRDRPFNNLPIAVAVGACTTLGTLLVFGCTLAGEQDASWQVPAKLLMETSSVFIVLWGERLCALDGRSALIGVLTASVVSLVVVLAASLLPSFAQAACQAVMPALSAATLATTARRSATDMPKQNDKRTPQDAACPVPLRAFCGLALFGTTVILLQLFSEAKTDQPDELLWIVAGLAVDAVLLALSLTRSNGIKASSLSRFIPALLVLSVFLVFATNFGQQAIEVFLIGCAWIYLKLFTWIVWRLGALRSPWPAATVVALGQLLLTAGTVVGELSYAMLSRFAASQLMVMALICILSIVVSMFLLDTRSVAELADEKAAFDPENRAMCERCIDRATERYGLSGQERAIALMLVRGDGNEGIRKELFITNNTLRTHLRNMYRKTETHSREDLVLLLRSLR